MERENAIIGKPTGKVLGRWALYNTMSDEALKPHRHDPKFNCDVQGRVSYDILFLFKKNLFNVYF